MEATCLVTGATGLVGSHLAEASVAKGWKVRALVRPGTDAAFLEKLGVELTRGDLADARAVAAASEGADFVFHCAAKVGDWGGVEEYRAVNVAPLRTLLDACRSANLKRFVLLSSLGVYPARDHRGTDESEPLPDSHMDGYTISKVEAERLARDFHERQFVPLTILRPGFIYGPRDRTLLPKLIDNLRARQVKYIGSSRLALNCIYVKNLVEAFFLAAESPKADGQAYNLTDGEPVSKRRFIESVCDGLGLAKPSRLPVPRWIARAAAWWMERKAKKRGATEAPRLTQARLKFIGLNLDFSIAKARDELGYRPPYSFDEGMRETIAWLRKSGEAANVEGSPQVLSGKSGSA